MPVDRAVAPSNVEHHPLVEVPAPGARGRRRSAPARRSGRRLDLGQVAEHADVDAEQRHRRAVEQLHGAQHRAVAAEADDQVGVGRRALADQVGAGRARRRRRRRSTPSWPCSAQPRRRRRARRRRRLGRSWWATTATRWSRRTRSAVRRRRARGTRGCPSPPTSGESIQPRTAQPASTSAASISSRTRSWISRIGDHAPAPRHLDPAGLELRLDQQHHRRPRLAQRRSAPG